MMSPKTILILLGLGLLAISTVGILSFSLIETKQQAKSLKKQLEYMEGNIELAKKKNLHKLDSLQVIIDERDYLNKTLINNLDEVLLQKQPLTKLPMKEKLLFLALGLSTVFTAQSQDTTDNRQVTFPFWMAREIALDLEEKSRLEANEKITAIELATLTSLVKSLEKTNQTKDLQIELLRSSNALQQQQLTTSKLQKQYPGTFTWILRLIAAFSIGYVIGNF